MKKLLIVFFASLTIAGCKKIHLTTFNIDNSATFTIPASTPAGPYSAIVSTSSQSSFAQQGTDASHLQNVSLDKISLVITNPAYGTFDFMDNIHIYVSASGQAEQEVAYLNPIPHNASVSINLNATGTELVDYIKQNNYNIRISATTNQLPTEDVTMKANMTFKVKAKLL